MVLGYDKMGAVPAGCTDSTFFSFPLTLQLNPTIDILQIYGEFPLLA